VDCDVFVQIDGVVFSIRTFERICVMVAGVDRERHSVNLGSVLYFYILFGMVYQYRYLTGEVYIFNKIKYQESLYLTKGHFKSGRISLSSLSLIFSLPTG
jgi:hypothetical protein